MSEVSAVCAAPGQWPLSALGGKPSGKWGLETGDHVDTGVAVNLWIGGLGKFYSAFNSKLKSMLIYWISAIRNEKNITLHFIMLLSTSPLHSTFEVHIELHLTSNDYILAADFIMKRKNVFLVPVHWQMKGKLLSIASFTCLMDVNGN